MYLNVWSSSYTQGLTATSALWCSKDSRLGILVSWDDQLWPWPSRWLWHSIGFFWTMDCLSRFNLIKFTMTWFHLASCTAAARGSCDGGGRQLETVVHFKLLVGIEHAGELLQHIVYPCTTTSPFPCRQALLARRLLASLTYTRSPSEMRSSLTKRNRACECCSRCQHDASHSTNAGAGVIGFVPT